MHKRTHLSSAALIVLGGFASLAHAQSDAPTQMLERVEVTGSSIKRVDAETALPVTVMTRAEIDRSGATTAQDLVNLIPSNFGGSVVANNVGATGVASTAGLRGLPSKYTLVLLNGRRVANYAFGNSPVDLNSIPLSAVERVEVLRDGASAIYGADAVAGVINFILRKNYQGLEASAYDTRTQLGGGNSKVFSLTGGFGDYDKQGFNVLVSASHEVDDVLKAKDRSYAASAVVPSLGINKASPRNGIPNLNFTDTKGNAYTGINPMRYNGCNDPAFALVVISATQCGTDYVKYIDLIPSQKHDNVVARGGLKLDENNELYAEAMYIKDSTVASYSPAPYTVNMTYPTTGRFYPTTITLPKGMTLPAGYIMPNGTVLSAPTVLSADMAVTPTGPLSGTWRTVAGGGRTDLTDMKTKRALIGARGTVFGDWDYDTALTFTENQGLISFGPGQYSYAALTPLVASGAINVFGAQDATSQKALDSALLKGPEQSATSKSTEWDGHVSREMFQLPGGPVNIAVGASFRKEELSQYSYPVLASGDQVGGNGPVPSVTGDRKVYGLYSEANIPVTKQIELDLAARYDNYKNGFGTSFNNVAPKASLRFQPSKELLARASAGTGYRAPSLYDNLRPFTSGNNTAANWSDPVRCPGGTALTGPTGIYAVGHLQDECSVQLSTATVGNPNVKPEKSKQFSLGVVFSPSNALTTSIDYWNVRISDVILPKSEISVMRNPSTYNDFFYRYDPALFPNGWVDDGKQTGAIKGSTNPNFPLAYVFLPYDNQGKYFAAGFDVNLQFKQKISGLGVFGVNLDGTLTTKHGYQYPNTPYASDLGQYGDFGATPRWRHALTFALSTDSWNTSLTQNLTSSYQDYNGSEAVSASYPATRTVKQYQLWDGQIGYKGLKNLDIGVGVKNIFNADPPVSRNELNFQTGYDATYANPLGRTYYFRVKYKFF